MEKSSLKVTDNKLVTYKTRWVILAIISIVSALKSLCMQSLAAINDVLSVYLDRAPKEIDWLSGSMSFSVIPTCLLLVLFSSKFNLHSMTILASAFITAGLILVCVAISSGKLFELILIGQILNGASSGLLMVCPVIMSSRWFSDKETATVLSLPWLFSSITSALAGILSTNIVPQLSYLNGTDIELLEWKADVKNSLAHLFGSFLVVAIFSLGLSIFLIKNYPPTPPTLSQCYDYSKAKEHNETNCIKEFKKNYKENIYPLLKCRSYYLLTASYFLIVVALPTVTVLQSSMVRKGFPQVDDRESAKIALSSYLIGSLGGPLSGFVIDHTKKFKMTVILGIFILLAGVLSQILTYRYDAFPVLYFANSVVLFGTEFCFVGITEFMVEVTYPLNKLTTTGIFMVWHSAADILYIGLERLILQENIFLLSLLPIPNLVLSQVLIIFHKYTFKRKNANEVLTTLKVTKTKSVNQDTTK